MAVHTSVAKDVQVRSTLHLAALKIGSMILWYCPTAFP